MIYKLLCNTGITAFMGTLGPHTVMHVSTHTQSVVSGVFGIFTHFKVWAEHVTGSRRYRVTGNGQGTATSAHTKK